VGSRHDFITSVEGPQDIKLNKKIAANNFFILVYFMFG